ncbi:hypothetical protein [Kribbella endophytica]
MELEGETPTPRLVAAWVVLGVVPTEQMPMWAAEWIVQGYDGEALAELAGLSGRDPGEVRDLLPAALGEVGAELMPEGQAAMKLEYDHVAELHLGGRVSWAWVVTEVARVADASQADDGPFEQPLGGLRDVECEMGEPWRRTDLELAEVVRAACVAQLKE